MPSKIPRSGGLWRSDGTSAGTTRLGDIASPPTAFMFPQPILRQQLVVGQKLFFVATDAEIGDELYVLTNDAPIATADNASSLNSPA